MLPLAMSRSASAIVEPVELKVAAGARRELFGGFLLFSYCLFVDDSAKSALRAFGCENEWSEWLPWVFTQCPFCARSHTHHQCLFFRVCVWFTKHAITPALRSLSSQPPKSSSNMLT